MKKITLTLILILGIGAAIYLFARSGSSEKVHEAGLSRPITFKSVAEATPGASVSATNQEEAPQSKTESREAVRESVAVAAPDLEEIRKEVARDPHTTPRSLLDFAYYLGGRMKEARGSSEKAKQFFEELSDCVKDQKFVSSSVIQSTCLSNAQRLAKIKPEFQPLMKDLEESASPEVRKLAR